MALKRQVLRAGLAQLLPVDPDARAVINPAKPQHQILPGKPRRHEHLCLQPERAHEVHQPYFSQLLVPASWYRNRQARLRQSALPALPQANIFRIRPALPEPRQINKIAPVIALSRQRHDANQVH